MVLPQPHRQGCLCYLELFARALQAAHCEWQAKVELNFVLNGDRNERIVSYKVSRKLPEYFEVETNPVLMLHSSEN